MATPAVAATSVNASVSREATSRVANLCPPEDDSVSGQRGLGGRLWVASNRTRHIAQGRSRRSVQARVCLPSVKAFSLKRRAQRGNASSSAGRGPLSWAGYGPHAGDASNAWSVEFSTGRFGHGPVSNTFQVRCVR